jgi:hypothetical protein
VVKWQATIARTEGVIDSKSRMSYLVAEINDPYERSEHRQPLRFGTYVSADIMGLALKQATLVPRHLVVQSRVAVMDDNDKLHFKTVTISREQGGDAVITGGLSSGDRLITSALDYQVEGMALTLPLATSALDTANAVSTAAREAQ